MEITGIEVLKFLKSEGKPDYMGTLRKGKDVIIKVTKNKKDLHVRIQGKNLEFEMFDVDEWQSLELIKQGYKANKMNDDDIKLMAKVQKQILKSLL